jgi:site-specific DNA recombinase
MRVSTEEQRKGQTIEHQLVKLRQWVGELGCTVEDERRYADDGHSGYDIDRVGIRNLMEDAANKRIDVVFVTVVDRIARHNYLTWDVKLRLQAFGIPVLVHNMPGLEDLGEGQGDLMWNMNSGYGQFERWAIANRLREAKWNKARAGRVVGCSVPKYGYRYVRRDPIARRDGYYVLEPTEASWVKRIYAWAKAGLTIGQIVRRLAEKGAPPPISAKSKGQRGTRWHRSGVSRILTDRIYSGVTYYGKNKSIPRIDSLSNLNKKVQRLRDREEWVGIDLDENLRIVDDQTFNAVQEQLVRNRHFSGRNNKKHDYLLRGLLRCECGYSWVGNPHRAGLTYRCSNRTNRFPEPKSCPTGSVRCEDLDGLVLKAVRKVVLDPERVMAHVRTMEKKAQAHPHGDSKEKVRLGKELEQAKQEQRRLFDALRLGTFPVEEIQRASREVQKRIEELEQGLRIIEAQEQLIPPLPVLRRTVKKWCNLAAKRFDNFSPQELQQFLRLTISRVQLAPPLARIQVNIPLQRSESLGGITSQQSRLSVFRIPP